MINTWFTSDHHFGHAKILEYEPNARPFLSVEEMTHVLIERWNKVVKPQDLVYHLGDFCFGDIALMVAGLLNGRKKLILGNHDNLKMEYYQIYFEKIYGALFWKRCLMTHIPVYRQEGDYRWLLNIHGHLHGKKIDNPHYFNVSVEQNNLTPIHADVILKARDAL